MARGVGTEVLRMSERDELRHYIPNPLNPTGRSWRGDPPAIIPSVHWHNVTVIIEKIGPPPVLLYSLDDEVNK